MSSWETSKGTKHWIVQPSMHDPFYICGGWQIFNRMYDLVSRVREVEIVTYRHRENGFRYLADVPTDELNSGIIWVTWQSHVTELAERLANHSQVVLYAQAVDFGKERGQVTPAYWPIVCLSRYIAADYSVRHPWRLILYLGTALHSGAKNYKVERDIDVLVHKRKSASYLIHELVPALRKVLKVEVVTDFLKQEDYFALLNRTKVYLYWFHKTAWGTFEGLGMQPLEAVACGATPISNFYGGLSDYLEAPFNCRKIGVHSLSYDVEQIAQAVREHNGSNADEERIRFLYGVEMFYERFFRIERELIFYFARCPKTPYQVFRLEPPEPPLYRRPYIWLHRQVWRKYKSMKGVLPR